VVVLQQPDEGRPFEGGHLRGKLVRQLADFDRLLNFLFTLLPGRWRSRTGFLLLLVGLPLLAGFFDVLPGSLNLQRVDGDRLHVLRADLLQRVAAVAIW
jgi:hypothetical protein